MFKLRYLWHMLTARGDFFDFVKSSCPHIDIKVVNIINFTFRSE